MNLWESATFTLFFVHEFCPIMHVFVAIIHTGCRREKKICLVCLSVLFLLICHDGRTWGKRFSVEGFVCEKQSRTSLIWWELGMVCHCHFCTGIHLVGGLWWQCWGPGRSNDSISHCSLIAPLSFESGLCCCGVFSPLAAPCLSRGRKCWMVGSHACGVALVHWKPDAWSLGLKIMHSPGSSSYGRPHGCFLLQPLVKVAGKESIGIGNHQQGRLL